MPSVTPKCLHEEKLRLVRQNLLRVFMQSHSVAEHHVASFNRCITVDIPSIVKNNACLRTKVGNFFVVYRVSKCFVVRPQNSPLVCQQQNLTYASTVFADIVRHIFTCGSLEDTSSLFFEDTQEKLLRNSYTKTLARRKDASASPQGPQPLLAEGSSLKRNQHLSKGEPPPLLFGKSYAEGEDLRRSAQVTLDTMKVRDRQEYTKVLSSTMYHGVKICDLPCMVGSKLCVSKSSKGDVLPHPDTEALRIYDDYGRREHGGHFIVNGKRRFIPLTKSVASNQMLWFNLPSKNKQIVQFRSRPRGREHRSTYTLEISIDVENKLFRKNKVAFSPMVKIPFFPRQVPLSILHQSLGRTHSDFWDDVRAMTPSGLWSGVRFEKYRSGLLFSSLGVSSQKSALSYLGSSYGRYQGENAGYSALFCEVFPNLNTVDRGDRLQGESYASAQKALNLRKSQQLALCLSVLILSCEGIIKDVDRNDRSVVRYVDAGSSVAVLLRMQLVHCMSQSLKIFRRFVKAGKEVDVEKIYNSTRLGDSILRAVATGTFTSMRKGMCHPMNTTNQTVIRSQLRQISSTSAEGMHIKKRMLHPSSLGYECASETPEGRSCGLVGQLASTCTVTLRFDANLVAANILQFLRNLREQLPHGGFQLKAEIGPRASGSSAPGAPECACLGIFRQHSCREMLRSTVAFLLGTKATRASVMGLAPLLGCTCLRPTVLEPRRRGGEEGSRVRLEWKLLGPSGEILGWTQYPWLLREIVAEARRRGVIHRTTSVCVDADIRAVKVYSDAGRACRPLLGLQWLRSERLLDAVVREMRAADSMGWTPRQVMAHLVRLGVVQYVTPCEERNLRPTFKYLEVHCAKPGPCSPSHLEVSDISIVGRAAARVPLSNHCQGPRLAYGVGLSKQTIAADEVDRGANHSYRLLNGHRALTYTSSDKASGGSRSREYTNVVIAVYPMRCNQEDAVVINRNLLDMGGFAISSSRWYGAEIAANCNTRSKKLVRSTNFARPDADNTLLRNDAEYGHLGADGLPQVGARLDDRCAVIGKTCPMKVLSSNAKVSAPNECFRAKKGDQSVLMKRNEQGTVSSAQIYRGKDGRQTAKVKVSTFREYAEIGDKLTSRHAQKGTIGRIADPEDLPFEMETGIVPDLIFSPLGITSRMTMATVLEIFFGLTTCVTGELLHGLDEQDFEGDMELRLRTMQNILHKAGLARTGKVTMVDGESGETIQIPIYRGVVSYARLVQLVSNKAHARGAAGPVDRESRQPTEGKAKGGGHRFGEMEINILIAYGAWNTLQERMVVASDGFDIYVCRKCDNMAVGNPELGYYSCEVCGTGDLVVPVQITWSTKCVVQSLMAQKIKVKLHVEV